MQIRVEAERQPLMPKRRVITEELHIRKRTTRYQRLAHDNKACSTWDEKRVHRNRPGIGIQ
jgi:hypothetical protein